MKSYKLEIILISYLHDWKFKRDVSYDFSGFFTVPEFYKSRVGLREYSFVRKARKLALYFQERIEIPIKRIEYSAQKL